MFPLLVSTSSGCGRAAAHRRAARAGCGVVGGVGCTAAFTSCAAWTENISSDGVACSGVAATSDAAVPTLASLSWTFCARTMSSSSLSARISALSRSAVTNAGLGAAAAEASLAAAAALSSSTMYT